MGTKLPKFCQIQAINPNLGTVVNKMSLLFGQTARADMYLRLTEKALGDFRNESAIEVNLVRETSIFFARVAGLALVYIALQLFVLNNLETLLRIILPLASVAVLVVYMMLKHLNYSTKVF